ncbi:hypothetical protein [Pedobacter rhodius]|uniref:Uncharacterized protein n=1 Tax=Pedobacter rhodius TaxID=3004098 RepID=A0ABT4KYJ3_9SPHI|nr:hypothetical protein [Pedobacter sp. SJ11]MCZ4223989.1 hypothetical protein [Pedobacter sp. SJ11]
MIKKNIVAKNNRKPTVLKINPVKLKELLSAFELNTVSDSITIFTKVENAAIKEKVVYAEKSDFELAFEKFQNQEI